MQKQPNSSRLLQIIYSESFSGGLLCLTAVVALIIANSPYMHLHQQLFEHNFAQLFGTAINGHFIINDILMSLFFLQVGLEIKFEAKCGALADRKHALLPIIAACGGVIVPALIYLSFNQNTATIHGWAIPTATDIAFAVGVFSLLSRHFSRDLRIILLSIAIIDDILAILIIAIFYTPKFNFLPLLLTVISLAILALAPIKKYKMTLLALGLPAIWVGLYNAGIHPTLSGVIIGLLAPMQADVQQPTKNLEKFLSPAVNYFIMPAFALANGAVTLHAANITSSINIHIMLGIILGLCIGKPIGILLATKIGTNLKICHMPANINSKQMLFISLLTGIGFTMALFTILLSFSAEGSIQAAKLAVLLGSFISALLGLSYGYYLTKKQL